MTPGSYRDGEFEAREAYLRRLSADVECPRCHGAGEIEVSWQAAKQCPKCGGSGVVEHDLNEDCDDD